jgi:ADP-heptose:LPS heptosyltransferase
MSAPHVLVARLDNDGDVLLTGPAVRAVAAGARRVTFLCGPRGRAAAELLPGVDEVLTHQAPWIDPEPGPVSREATLELVDAIAGREVDQALVLTSFHQSALPLALLLRLAGVAEVAAISEDYPGSLLDVRHHVPAGAHEVERSLSLAATLGHRLPRGDDGGLRVRRPAAAELAPEVADWAERGPYAVVHPGASAPARAFGPRRSAVLVDALVAAGWRVMVTGTPTETSLTAYVTGPPASERLDAGGATDLAQLAELLAGAAAVVVGNTGPAHLAAAVGTPVVSLFAPTVPAERWHPWRVPHELLHAPVPCAGCRARECPVAGHPCLEGVAVERVVEAVDRLAGPGARAGQAPQEAVVP